MKNEQSDHIERNIQTFNLLTSLLSILNQNNENDTDFIIARYFLDHLDEIKNTSIYTVAEECFLSRSSVQRFIKNIGFDSYTQLKNGLDEVLNHENGFISYTDHAEFRNYLSDRIIEMLRDIEETSSSNDFRHLAELFTQADRIIILTAEDSSSACRLFQQQILTTGKLVRILTSASSNISLLNSLNEKDLLIVCSVTGNFALAIDRQLQEIRARKCLITVNKTTFFQNTYSFIYYLGRKLQINSRNIVSSRNVYNNYGLTFFFDLFFHECFLCYQKQH
ncbi:MAG: MurR/RpiR family transcriptional regulator [Erysipelotrichaceae bacterium]|nr:MurR/RpiR family transcriptional regulator [Erysipelotrichaceae bacterium]